MKNIQAVHNHFPQTLLNFNPFLWPHAKDLPNARQPIELGARDEISADFSPISPKTYLTKLVDGLKLENIRL